MTASLLIENIAPLCKLTLNEPSTKNAISADMITAIVKACCDINNDPNISVVILTGNGSVFSSGGNIKDMLRDDSMFSGKAADITQKYQQGIQQIPQALLSLNVPLIAAVNGPAIGAGMDMSLCADLRIASHSAFFAHNFCKLGLISGDGGHWLLARALGYSQACALSFTGRRISSDQALALGLINRRVADDKLLAEALSLAHDIAKNPRPALIGAKQLTQQALKQTFAEAQQQAATMQGHLHNTQEHKARVEQLIKDLS